MYPANQSPINPYVYPSTPPPTWSHPSLPLPTKVDEINTILENEITPTLDRLRGEKTQFLKWASNDAEAQRLQKFCVAHNFVEAEAKLNSSNGEKQELEEQRDALQATQAEAAVSRWCWPNVAGLQGEPWAVTGGGSFICFGVVSCFDGCMICCVRG